ncbi:MAG: hypothetical protein LBO67_02525 [Spirochaetaceae bacterium]|jgi:hypothetical protein|nr:hypothetical protein [Spirochaetaceae bacterium]
MKLKRKYILIRLVALLIGYTAVIIIFVAVQSTQRINLLTLKQGNVILSSRYSKMEQTDSGVSYLLTGTTSIAFNGIEFRFGSKSADTQQDVNPERLTVTPEGGVMFTLPDGTALTFNETQEPDVAAHLTMPELMIQAAFSSDNTLVELPYHIARTAEIKNSESGQLIIGFDNVDYCFDQPQMAARTVLSLRPENTVVVYHALPENAGSNPSLEDFVLSSAQTQAAYTESLNHWRDRNFSLWRQSINTSNDEELVIAFIGEALRQGSYQAAVSAVPAIFKNGTRRTFESTGYLGRLDLGLRSLTTTERTTLNRFSTLIQNQSQDILKESHSVLWLITRAHADLITGIVGIVRAIDPQAIAWDIIPGIFEGYVDFAQHKAHEENPFVALIDPALTLITENVGKIAQDTGVLVFNNEAADIEYNLRLGKALMVYGDMTSARFWSAMGRSLILSVLALEDTTATVPARLDRTGAALDETRIVSSRLYRLLTPDDNYPHAVKLDPPEGSIWTWTVSPLVRGTRETGFMDIQVNFPVGETHYMFIRGIARPSRIQLHERNWPSDPQYERYDSSGWIYSASEETLLIKMKHRAETEHIQIYF